jgi:hypothetical protein
MQSPLGCEEFITHKDNLTFIDHGRPRTTGLDKSGHLLAWWCKARITNFCIYDRSHKLYCGHKFRPVLSVLFNEAELLYCPQPTNYLQI